MKTRILIGTAVVVFLGALLLQAPADRLWGWLQPADGTSPLQAYGVQGHLGSGSLAGVDFNGQPLLRDLRWQWQPWTLPLLRAGFHVTSSGEPLTLDGNIAAGLGGLRAGPLVVGGTLRAIAAILGQGFAPVDGQLRADIAELSVRKGWPQSVTGTLQIHELALTLSQPATTVGSYQADLSTEGDTVLARISTLAGSVDASGEVRLEPDRSYTTDLRLRARADAPPVIVNLLQSLGQPDAQGTVTVKQSGQLPS